DPCRHARLGLESRAFTVRLGDPRHDALEAERVRLERDRHRRGLSRLQLHPALIGHEAKATGREEIQTRNEPREAKDTFGAAEHSAYGVRSVLPRETDRHVGEGSARRIPDHSGEAGRRLLLSGRRGRNHQECQDATEYVVPATATGELALAQDLDNHRDPSFTSERRPGSSRSRRSGKSPSEAALTPCRRPVSFTRSPAPPQRRMKEDTFAKLIVLDALVEAEIGY